MRGKTGSCHISIERTSLEAGIIARSVPAPLPDYVRKSRIPSLQQVSSYLPIYLFFNSIKTP